MSDHTGQGFAVRAGATYRTLDRDELARRAAEREAGDREARLESLRQTEEGERRTVAQGVGEGAASRSYYEQGGRAVIRWVVTAVPIEDETEEAVFGGLS